jgi:hypothetical protein
MKCFEEVNIPSWPTIQQYCISGWDGEFTTSKSYKGKDLSFLGNLLEPDIKLALGLDVKIKSAILFISPPKFQQEMHVDGFSIDRNNASNTALNLPILNCSTTTMYWYNGIYHLSESTSNTSKTIKYLQIDWETEPSVVNWKIIDTPTLVKINIPHHIENQSDLPRLMLSVRFNPDIQLG